MDATFRPGQVNTLMGSMGSLEDQQANVDRPEVYLPRLRTARHTVTPSILGSIRSSTITSNGSAPASRSAASPSAAVATSSPSSPRWSETSSRMFGSSSTTSARLREPPGSGVEAMPSTTTVLGAFVTRALQSREDPMARTARPKKQTTAATRSSYCPYMTAQAASRETRENASELKFIVDPDTASGIRALVRTLLTPDPYASGPAADEYRTTSLYFDTEDLAVYHRRGSYRRAKYRVRRYGHGDVVFLERKLRTADVLTKRRTAVRIEQLAHLTSESVDPDWPGQWFRERVLMRRLSPVCLVSYRRMARVGVTDYGPIRLTIDDDVTGTMAHGAHFSDGHRQCPLTVETIVEMKFRAAMPAVFKRVVEEFALQPVRVSKYRLGMEATRPSVGAYARARAAAQGSTRA